jgi:hypothetical protein
MTEIQVSFGAIAWLLGAKQNFLLLPLFPGVTIWPEAALNKITEFLTSPAFGFYVKFIAGFAAAGFGLMGVGAKTRNDDNSLTGKGRIALVGILVSGLFAAASVTYDYFVAQKAARSETEKSRRLLLSVQRGIYPLRGIKANFVVRLSKDFAGLAEYSARVRKAIDADRDCTHTIQFTCDDPEARTDYMISSSSSLFPEKGSKFRRVLENLSLEVLMLKRTYTKPGEAKYDRVGSFNIDVGSADPNDWHLQYSYDDTSLYLQVNKYHLEDDAPVGSQVYSLVDFIPGVIAVGNSKTTPHACHTAGGCDFKEFTSLMKALVSGLDVANASLSFGYPKGFEFNRYASPFGDFAAIECSDENAKYLVLKTPDDIELQSILSINPAKISDLEKKQICKAVLTPVPEQPIPSPPKR